MLTVRTKGRWVIAVDDTDNPEQGGTGRVAREIAGRLAGRWPIWGVTRHQFAVLPEIPYTRNNSGNAIHLLQGPDNAEGLAEEVGGWLGELSLEGSHPTLCVARPEVLLGCDLGRAAQKRYVHPDEARRAADGAGVILVSLRGKDGLVGAFAGACLASQGDDGRFVERGTLRALEGEVALRELLAAGVDEVKLGTGTSFGRRKLVPVPSFIIAERLRPALRGGKCVLYCRPDGAGRWTALAGGPDDPQKGKQPNGEPRSGA